MVVINQGNGEENENFEFGEARELCTIFTKNKALIRVEKDGVVFHRREINRKSVMIFSEGFVGALNKILEFYFYDEKIVACLSDKIFTSCSSQEPDHGIQVFLSGKAIPNKVMAKIISCAKYFSQEILYQSELDGAEKVTPPSDLIEVLADEVDKYRRRVAGNNIDVPFYLRFAESVSEADYLFQGRYDEGVVAEKKTTEVLGFARPVGVRLDLNQVYVQPVSEDNFPINKQIEFKVKTATHMRVVVEALYHGFILEFKGVSTESERRKERINILQEIKITDKSSDLF